MQAAQHQRCVWHSSFLHPTKERPAQELYTPIGSTGMPVRANPLHTGYPARKIPSRLLCTPPAVHTWAGSQHSSQVFVWLDFSLDGVYRSHVSSILVIVSVYPDKEIPDSGAFAYTFYPKTRAAFCGIFHRAACGNLPRKRTINIRTGFRYIPPGLCPFETLASAVPPDKIIITNGPLRASGKQQSPHMDDIPIHAGAFIPSDTGDIPVGSSDGISRHTSPSEHRSCAAVDAPCGCLAHPGTRHTAV